MPQLFSRMDDMNWLTPAIADILDQGATPPGGDGSTREQMLTLQRELAEFSAPARVSNTRPTPSYTLFALQPEGGTGWLGGGRRSVGMNELRRAVSQIAERHKEWKIGFMPRIDPTVDSPAILLRTDQHRPLSLRRLLVQSQFRNHPSNFAFTLGLTLDQQLIVRDLEQIEHLMIVGEGNARHHLTSSILLTLLAFNTPSEMRLIMAGDGTERYEPLATLPHSTGKPIRSSERITRLLDGMTSEAQRRLNVFYEEGVNLFDSYNARLREQKRQAIPRILIVLDALSDEPFKADYRRLISQVRDLLLNGAQVGIHLIVAFNAPESIPAELNGIIRTTVYLRSSAPNLSDKLEHFHNSLLRFVDAFVIEEAGERVYPVELCAVSAQEIANTRLYWQNAQAHRQGDETQESGLTGILPPLPAPMPEIEQVIEVSESLPFNEPEPEAHPYSQRAALLAAYLGWLSVNALCDIYDIPDTAAEAIISALQNDGIIERGSASGMYRFVRLGEPPHSPDAVEES